MVPNSRVYGVGVYILRPHAAGIFDASPLLYTPHA